VGRGFSRDVKFWFVGGFSRWRLVGRRRSQRHAVPSQFTMPNIAAIQSALCEQKLDGWLFYDILHRDPIAYRVLGLGYVLAKRRWFYMIPAKGTPRKLVHRIEAATLDSLPGDKMLYAAGIM
jgi:hypothetical protein